MLSCLLKPQKFFLFSSFKKKKKKCEEIFLKGTPPIAKFGSFLDLFSSDLPGPIKQGRVGGGGEKEKKR